VAEELYELNNIDGLFGVVNALNEPNIKRLKLSWKEVEKKDLFTLSQFRKIVSMDGNFKVCLVDLLVFLSFFFFFFFFFIIFAIKSYIKKQKTPKKPI
jgi:hypothetical protein